MFHSYQNENNTEFPKLEEICSQKSRNYLEIAVLTVKLLSFISIFNFDSNSLMVQIIDNALMWIIVAAASFFLMKKDHSCTVQWKRNLLKLLHRIWNEYKPSWDTIAFFWFGLQYDLTSRKHCCFHCSITDQKQAEIWQAVASGATEELAFETLILVSCKSRYSLTRRGCS